MDRHDMRTDSTPPSSPEGFGTLDVSKVRRIVTAIDEDGKAFAAIDAPCPHSGTNPKFPGVAGATLWRESHEIDLKSTVDNVAQFKRIPPGGSQFILSQIDPGVYVAPHSTTTIDHHFVLSGEITCIFEESEFTASAGDVIIQRGTLHAWENRGDVPFISAIFMRSLEADVSE